MTTSNPTDPIQEKVIGLLRDLANGMDKKDPYHETDPAMLVSKFMEAMTSNGLSFTTFIPEKKNVRKQQ
jgi:hypothetical protein